MKIFKTKEAEDLALSTQLVYLVAHVLFIGFGSQKNPMQLRQQTF
jgi:hypothetical protein